MLENFSPELLQMVARSVASKDDLKSLSLVSRAVHHGVHQTLWNSLDISPINENLLWEFESKSTFDRNLTMFTSPRELNFNSSFHQENGERCPHCRDLEDAGADNEDENSRYGRLAHTAKSVVEMIPAVVSHEDEPTGGQHGPDGTSHTKSTYMIIKA